MAMTKREYLSDRQKNIFGKIVPLILVMLFIFIYPLYIKHISTDTVVVTLPKAQDVEKYSFWTWEQSLILISWYNFRLKWWITDRLDQQYPSIILKSGNIENAILRVIVDFTPEFIKYNPWLVYSYRVLDQNGKKVRIPSTNFVFALKFWFGKVNNWNPEFWWWYNVANYEIFPINRYNNDIDMWLNGAFLGKDIVWWTEYLIPLDMVKVWNANRYSDNDQKYEEIYPINFIKSNKNKELPISIRLSSAGMRWTEIKYMELIYLWDPNAIQIIKSY